VDPDLRILKDQIISDLQAERWGAALEHLEGWCQRVPGDAKAWLNRGYCLMRLERFPEAMTALERSLGLDPELEKARQLHTYVASRIQRPTSTRPADGEPVRTERFEGAARTRQAEIRREGAQTVGTGRWRSTGLAGSATFGTQPAAESERVWLERAVVAGRYDVIESVRGGMGVVHIAFDRELQRVVAVKTPLPSVLASHDGRARFHREAEAWIALGLHPNICSALYVQEIGGMPRLFIEYVDGGDLAGLLKRDAEMTVGGRLDIAIQIARGMDYTHTFKWSDEDGVDHRGLVHRDLKPANILIALDGSARVTDFGLVRANMGDQPATDPEKVVASPREHVSDPSFGDSLSGGSWQTVTEAGGVLGTPPYLAPELWRQTGPASAASDIYAFGCVLYEVFCGSRPFVLPGSRASARVAQFAEWMRLHAEEAPPDPTRLRPGLDSELADLMTGCLAKSPENRPRSFDQLRRQLIEIYERSTGRAYPRPEPQRARLLADSLNNRAVSFVTLGNVARATRGLREALEIDHHHLEATFNMCVLEWRTKGLTDAEMLRRLEEARKASPESGRGNHLLGRLNLLLDDPGAGASAMRAAAAAGTAPLALRRDLGVALLATARASRDIELYREAEHELSTVVEESGNELAPLVGWAEALDALGESVEADRLWHRAREQSADLPETIEEAAALLLPGHRKRFVLHHSQSLQSCALAADELVVCRDVTGGVSVWDVKSARVVRTFNPGPSTGRGRSLAVFPGGQRIAVAVEDQPVGVWDVGSGDRVMGFRTHPGRVTCLAVTPDGRWLISGGSDRRVRRWEVTTGQCDQTFEGHDAFITDASVAPDGKSVATTSGDGTIRVWDLARGTEVRVFRGHQGATTAVCWDPSARTIVSGGEDGTVRVWDYDSGSLMNTLIGHGRTVSVLRIVVGESAVILSGSSDGTVRMWDLEAALPSRIVRLSHPVIGLVIPQEGTRVLVAHGSEVAAFELPHDVAVKLPFTLAEPADAGELEQRETTFRGRLNAAREDIGSEDFEGAISQLREARAIRGYGQNPEALELWSRVLAHFPRASPREHAELHQFKGHRGQLTAATFMADSRHAVSGGVDGTVRMWDLATGEETGLLTGHGGPVTAAAVTPNGRLLLTASRDGTVRVWRIASGKCIRQLRPSSDAVNDVASSPDSRWAVTAGEDGAVLLWEIGDESPAQLVGQHHDAVAAIAVGADGRFAVSGGWDSQLIVWNLHRRTEIQRFGGHDGPIRAVAVSPDCRLVATAGEDSTVRLWDRETERCWRELRDHEGPVQAVAFSPDARFLLTGGRDSTLRLWDVRNGSCVLLIKGHTGAVTAVDFSRDGRYAVSAGTDSSLRYWFLDWEPELVDSSGWDDRVRPFLDVFLRRQMSPDGSGSRIPPSWTDDQIQELMEDLARRGYGWLESERVREELDSLASRWGELRGRERVAVHRQEQRQQRRRRLRPARQALDVLTRNLAAKLISAALVVIAVPLFIMSMRSPEPTSAIFNDTVLYEVSHQFAIRQRELSDEQVAAFQGDVRTAMTGSASECSAFGFDEYLDLALHPERHTKEEIQPASKADDGVFRLRYHQAVNCLGDLKDTRAVQPILESFGSEVHPLRLEDLLSVLVRMGDAAIEGVTEALSSTSVAVRRLAATSMVYMGRPPATRALLSAIRGEDRKSQDAASFVLAELIVSGAIPEKDAFSVVQRLAHNIDPDVRRHALRALVAFERLGPVRDLLDEALDDSNPEVARTAAEVRDILRSAKVEKYFGVELEP